MKAESTQSDVVPRIAAFAAFISIIVLIAVFVFLTLTTTRFQDIQGGIDNHTMETCVDKFMKLVSNGPSPISNLVGINSFCYAHSGDQLLIDEEMIKRDNYVFQRNENVVLLYMVVIITFAGVLLAGLQLYASYKLATAGRGELAGGAEITYSPQGASFKSSVVGLSILALSFAFFLVFVLYVYTFRDPQNQNASAPARPPTVAAQPAPSQPSQSENSPKGGSPN